MGNGGQGSSEAGFSNSGSVQVLTDKKRKFPIKRRNSKEYPKKHAFYSQLCAVVRHTERADHILDWQDLSKDSWVGSEDFRSKPHDPPLSSQGLVHAVQLARELNTHVIENGVSFDLVVTSPYFRCVQTAVEICKGLGGVPLLVDQQFGEIYGPEVMGENQPLQTHQSMNYLKNYGETHGIHVRSKLLGDLPRWPETTSSARRRFTNRFLRYIYRGLRVRRNFLVVTHADAVASALSIIPSYDRIVTHVGYGGYFVASRERSIPEASDSLQSKEGINPNAEERRDVDLEEFEKAEIPNGYLGQTPTQLTAATAEWKAMTSGIMTSKKRRHTSLSQRIFRFKQENEYNTELIDSLLGELPGVSLGYYWPRSRNILEEQASDHSSDDRSVKNVACLREMDLTGQEPTSDTASNATSNSFNSIGASTAIFGDTSNPSFDPGSRGHSFDPGSRGHSFNCGDSDAGLADPQVQSPNLLDEASPKRKSFSSSSIPQVSSTTDSSPTSMNSLDLLDTGTHMVKDKEIPPEFTNNENPSISEYELFRNRMPLLGELLPRHHLSGRRSSRFSQGWQPDLSPLISAPTSFENRDRTLSGEGGSEPFDLLEPCADGTFRSFGTLLEHSPYPLSSPSVSPVSRNATPLSCRSQSATSSAPSLPDKQELQADMKDDGDADCKVRSDTPKSDSSWIGSIPQSKLFKRRKSTGTIPLRPSSELDSGISSKLSKASSFLNLSRRSSKTVPDHEMYNEEQDFDWAYIDDKQCIKDLT